ncbi:MAG: SAM-dependent chlorinase/fluorinase [Acidobacteriota bacterium]|nr:SAM-dependent chlorinase/fluorinase [Acidobacteriota bacterium]
MARPVIALLTDFGTRDHYTATMKAVALSICPEATLVDISHEIDPHDIFDGAIQLAATYHYFPASTIFLVVIDPGVGSGRSGLAAAVGGYRFVAPDNGVLSAVFAEKEPTQVVEITERRYARPTVSRTFEGRDKFAPAAAWLAKGVQLSALGRPTSKYLRLDLPSADVNSDGIKGQGLRVDRYGNAVTNITRKDFERLSGQGDIQLDIGSHRVERVVATYAEIEHGEVCALFGSTDHLELAPNSSSAAEFLQVKRGSKITILRTK